MGDAKISDLTAASALDGTEVFPVDQAAATKHATAAQIKTMVRRGGSAAAGSWPILGSGTVLTAPVAGAEEFDGTARYFTPADSSRAVDLAEYFIVTPDGGFALQSQATAQKLFGTPTNGALTLPVGTYLFEMLVYLTGMSATSGNAKLDILGGGNASVGSVLAHAFGTDGAAGSATNQTGSTWITGASPASVCTATIQTALYVSVRGTFRVTVAGTIIPSITLVTASAATVAAGSYFRCRPVGGTAFTNCGNWA